MMKLTSGRRMALIIGVLMTAAFLRLWQIARTPPGLHHDEAFHLLRAQEIARGEAFPVYITGNNGNEPLFAYLAAITVTLLGPVTWAGRLAAAWSGLVGVALAFRLGSEMFPGKAVGALAGWVLATFYWHLDFSRFGSQPILAAAAAAGTMAALWRGARTGNYWAYGLAGFALGLGLIAYVAFRLFPIVPLSGGLALWGARLNGRRSVLAGGMAAAGVALLVFAPLGLFFLQHPYWFFNRFSQTTESTLASDVLLTNTLRTMNGLFFHGDENWRHNLPGRPALDPVQLFCFLIGVGACLRRWRSPASQALLVWLMIGLVPSALTMEAPHFGRTTMVTPAIALLAALGLRTAWQWSQRAIVRQLIVAAVGLSSALTVFDYFERWAQADDLFAAFDGKQERIARALRAAPAGASLYATPVEGDAWTVEYLLGPDGFRRFRAFDGRACLVIPAAPLRPTTYAIIVTEDARTLPALQAAFPRGMGMPLPREGMPLPREGQPYLVLYQIPAGLAAQMATGASRGVDFGGLARMADYTLPAATWTPGGSIQLDVTWRVEQATPAAYKVFVHLIGARKADGGILYAQTDVEPCGGSYPTWKWSPGELVMDSYLLQLPEDLPGGDYTLQIGWYDGGPGGTGERLAATDEAGPVSDNAVKVKQVRIGLP